MIAEESVLPATETGCEAAEMDRSQRTCPESDTPGIGVDWLTVAALSRAEVPPRQRFWICRDPDCEIVYFGEEDWLLRISDLASKPSFKSHSPDALVCYCFLYSRSDIEREIVTRGDTQIPDRIAAAVKVGNCACKVRNPTGRCCLGEVQTTVQELRASLAVDSS